jgi:hypothetical protein
MDSIWFEQKKTKQKQIDNIDNNKNVDKFAFVAPLT